jgi:hypothetical protein
MSSHPDSRKHSHNLTACISQPNSWRISVHRHKLIPRPPSSDTGQNVALERCRSLYGQHGARLSPFVTSNGHSSWTISVLSLLTFGGPKSYHQVLQSWRDSRDATGIRWGPVITTLQTEWNDIILYVRAPLLCHEGRYGHYVDVSFDCVRQQYCSAETLAF